jgi:hypothetical protein
VFPIFQGSRWLAALLFGLIHVFGCGGFALDPLGFSGPFAALVFGFHQAMLSARKAGGMDKFCWRLAIESHERPTLIVILSPGFDDHFGFLQRFKPVQVQSFVAE